MTVVMMASAVPSIMVAAPSIPSVMVAVTMVAAPVAMTMPMSVSVTVSTSHLDHGVILHRKHWRKSDSNNGGPGRSD
jgi:hypothetical protein